MSIVIARERLNPVEMGTLVVGLGYHRGLWRCGPDKLGLAIGIP